MIWRVVWLRHLMVLVCLGPERLFKACGCSGVWYSTDCVASGFKLSKALPLGGSCQREANIGQIMKSDQHDINRSVQVFYNCLNNCGVGKAGAAAID
ncbi:hypothetical protein WH95_01535 [Kiloniella litopenaei]|uniref:Uncharacterized protein n=1 Tax=Kiloniella litopenaei TaxID=1549748 RepID=A0A0M2RAV2_9PROT|nr:hypothetical protein [Kiloniella litopenaei]KKJ78776.1 hypothetical protein WH95_01535 [Kiloniella litopenaei]